MKGTYPETRIDTSIQHNRGSFQAQSHNIKFRDNQLDGLQNLLFESMEIPNITLFKDKRQEEFELRCSHSLSHLLEDSIHNTSHYEDSRAKVENDSKSTSVIIGRTTFSCTTKQKNDFRVVSNKHAISFSSLPILLDFPKNAMSLFKNEIDHEYLHQSPKKSTPRVKALRKNSQYFTNNIEFAHHCLKQDRGKLVKPSEIISPIIVTNELFNCNEIWKQFQIELNFVDSFFESLQYLDNFSQSKKSTDEIKLANPVTNSYLDIMNLQYDGLLSKFENSANIDDMETISSKSLFLLNLLIRDEERRAKNLLFVLKLREYALKDFTKSQLLWLENKRKCENIDITTLKKKQRSSLLKLQLECGEMQRMRKALLSLSKKRKQALIRSKKNFDLKNDMTVNEIFLYKKKIKLSCSAVRSQLPLKCFDLTGSWRDNSIGPRLKPASGCKAVDPLHPQLDGARGRCYPTTAGKCSTRDSTTRSDRATATTDNKYVTVDGTYLNILLHNLELPDILSSGEKYEVSEDALKIIVSFANSHGTDINGDILKKFVNHIKTLEQDRSSSPSTARSLVEEFDQYYKDLAKEDQQTEVGKDSSDSTLETLAKTSVTGLKWKKPLDNLQLYSILTESDKSKRTNIPMEIKHWCFEEMTLQARPVAVPVGAVPSPESSSFDSSVIYLAKAKTDPTIMEARVSNISGSKLVSALSSPVHSEVEELRRQQLEIEREIKAIEQQQSQLLVIREIPDKPPPPYTPPTEQRVSKIPRTFYPEDDFDNKIRKYLLEDSSPNQGDCFDIFLSDICKEAAQKYRKESSNTSWNPLNILPQTPPLSRHLSSEKTSAEIREVLMGSVGLVTCTVINIGTRRSDDIDNILFAEWQRCEPEWKALQADDSAVKGRIYYSIFQSILNETMDTYEQTVLGKHAPYYLLFDTAAENE